MRESDRLAAARLGPVLEAEAFAGATTILCLAVLAGLAWAAQQDPTEPSGTARTLLAGLSEVLRWCVVVSLGLRGLGGLVHGVLLHGCGRFPWEMYGALGAGAIWLAGAALASASRTPEQAVWSAFVLAVLALGSCGLTVPVLWWLAGQHGDRMTERLMTARRAAARQRAREWERPAAEDA
jgi:hypothetical protein